MFTHPWETTVGQRNYLLYLREIPHLRAAPEKLLLVYTMEELLKSELLKETGEIMDSALNQHCTSMPNPDLPPSRHPSPSLSSLPLHFECDMYIEWLSHTHSQYFFQFQYQFHRRCP